MEKIILTVICVFLSEFAFSQSILEEDYQKVSVTKLKDALAKNLPELGAQEKELLSQKVILSKRVDLILALLEESEIQPFLAEKIKGLPEDGFKVAIIAESLKKNDLWVEKQKVNKGDQMTMMISLCENTLAHYFPNDPVNWPEYFNKNARDRLAASLIKAFNGDEIGKRDKSLYSSLPSHEPSLENGLSFEVGWNENKKKEDSRSDMKNDLREINLDDRRNREPSSSSNEKSQNQREIADSKKSNLPSVIAGVLLVGILALLLKVFKGKSTS